jgi:hypothetical protein
VAEDVSAPTIVGGFELGWVTTQVYEAMFRLQAAALAAALSVTFWPAETLVGTAMAAIGRSAAVTDLAALAIPAPQVVTVHRHSANWVSAMVAGT